MKSINTTTIKHTKVQVWFIVQKKKQTKSESNNAFLLEKYLILLLFFNLIHPVLNSNYKRHTMEKSLLFLLSRYICLFCFLSFLHFAFAFCVLRKEKKKRKKIVLFVLKQVKYRWTALVCTRTPRNSCVFSLFSFPLLLLQNSIWLLLFCLFIWTTFVRSVAYTAKPI